VLPGFEGAVLDPLSEAQLRSEAARAIFEAGAEAAEPWMGDYWALLAEGWTWRQAVYMLWEAQPAEGRAPKTQGALAVEVLGLTSDRVIRTWKAENPAMGARIARLTASALGKARARVIRALIESAASANYRAHADRKLFLEMSGDYVPRQTLRVGPVMPDEMEEMSEEELYRFLEPKVEPMAQTEEQFLAMLDSWDVEIAVLYNMDEETVSGLKGLSNDYFAEVVSRHPERLRCFAGIDPHKGMDAVREVERSVRELGLHGVAMRPFMQ